MEEVWVNLPVLSVDHMRCSCDLADWKGLICPCMSISEISRAMNMNRYIKKGEIEEMVYHCNEASNEEEEDEQFEYSPPLPITSDPLYVY